MKKKILLCLAMVLVPHYALSVDKVEQTFKDIRGNIQQTTGEHSGIQNEENKNANANESENLNKNTVIINIQTNAKEIAARLPESKQSIAKEVSDIAIDFIEASSTQDNSKIKDTITSKLAGLSLLSYIAAEPPFAPPVNKTQLMCRNLFKFSYRGYYAGVDGIKYIVNNQATGLIYPGEITRFKKNDMEVEIVYLEFSKENKTPVIYYECIPKS